MSEITSNDDLEVGKYYHCFDRRSGVHCIHQCKRTSSTKYLSSNKIWAEDENSQALERWLIYEVTNIPNIATISLCTKHHGHGFVSDCTVCKRNKVLDAVN